MKKSARIILLACVIGGAAAGSLGMQAFLNNQKNEKPAQEKIEQKTELKNEQKTEQKSDTKNA